MRTRPAPASRAASTCGRAASLRDLAAHDPGVERPPHDRHGDQRVREARAERGDHGDREHRAGQREEDVGDAHQQVVDPAAGGAGDQADRRHRYHAEAITISAANQLVRMP